jgi:hypothetical protein
MAFNNNGIEPLKVPGFGIAIDNEERDGFSHGANSWTQDPRLTVRELAMLKVLDALTDKPEWTRKVFDEMIVAKWREEAMWMPLISERAWNWCLAELQDKAQFYKETGYVLTLATGSVCAKSETLVSESLRNELLQAVQPLLDSPEKDWHPNSNDQILNLVHPSLFPLVYGKSRVLKTGRVSLDNFLNSYGQGEVIPGDQKVGDKVKDFRLRYELKNVTRWSTKFQWLPCEVAFKNKEGTDVEITSYINNLHPARHKTLYAVIEKMVGLAIPVWSDVLIRGDSRMPPRIQTFGSQFSPEFPKWINDLRQQPGDDNYSESVAKVNEYLALPNNPDYVEDMSDEDEERETGGTDYRNGTWPDSDYCSMWGAIDWKWKRMRKVLHPEPGIAYSYEDWKRNETAGAVVESSIRYGGCERRHDDYHVSIEDTFRTQGLQVIVKLASIELTPENPDYAGGSWHLEGMLNEHIVGTAIYYYDVDNTTESRIRFRQQAALDNSVMRYEQDDHEPLAEIFGCDSLREEPAVQELGSIATPQGRMLVFPNTLQHRVDPFTLEDKTRPGHRRFLVLWLVDPYYRVLSTRNVPPQRHDWWLEAGLDKARVFEKLPVELAEQLGAEIGEWPMGMDEAKKLRLELMAERTRLMDTIESNMETYNFCEH